MEAPLIYQHVIHAIAIRLKSGTAEATGAARTAEAAGTTHTGTAGAAHAGTSALATALAEFRIAENLLKLLGIEILLEDGEVFLLHVHLCALGNEAGLDFGDQFLIAEILLSPACLPGLCGIHVHHLLDPGISLAEFFSVLLVVEDELVFLIVSERELLDHHLCHPLIHLFGVETPALFLSLGVELPRHYGESKHRYDYFLHLFGCFDKITIN